MRKYYISALFLISLFFTQSAVAQQPCHASFYLDTVNSTPFNAVLVNNSVSYLTPPDSALYLWMWGDGTSSTGKTPSHTYTSPGTKYIFLTMYNVNKTCSDSFMKAITIDTLGGFHKTNGSYSIRVVAAGKTGIQATSTESFVTLTPGIVKDYAKLTFGDAGKNELVEASIFSYNGKNVLSVSERLNGNTIQMQTSSLPAGMYFAVIKSEGKTATIKFVKE